MRSFGYLLIIGIIFTLFSSPVLAISEIEIPITDYAVIAENNQSNKTVLFLIPVPESLETSTITYAEIIFNVRPIGNSDSTFEILSIPINIEWEPETVEWDNNWDELGGNMIDSLRSFHGISLSDEGISNIDITDTIIRWQDGTVVNNGMALKVPQDSQVRIRLRPVHPQQEYVALCRILYEEN